jgi:hypothetical protein
VGNIQTHIPTLDFYVRYIKNPIRQAQMTLINSSFQRMPATEAGRDILEIGVLRIAVPIRAAKVCAKNQPTPRANLANMTTF